MGTLYYIRDLAAPGVEPKCIGRMTAGPVEDGRRRSRFYWCADPVTTTRLVVGTALLGMLGGQRWVICDAATEAQAISWLERLFHEDTIHDYSQVGRSFE